MSDSSDNERRRDRRVSADVAVTVEWDGTARPAVLKDISRGGAAVVVEGAPPVVDAPVELRLGDNTPNFHVALPSTVVMVRRLRREGTPQYALHLRFEPL